jgi:signal transduction histidine kinase/CheY-like chemotaxis protein
MASRPLHDEGLDELGVRALLVGESDSIDAAAAHLGVERDVLATILATARRAGHAVDGSIGLVAQRMPSGTFVLSLAAARAEARAWAGVAHELGNALTTIAGWADVAAATPDPDASRHAIRTVQASIRDAMDIAPLLLERRGSGDRCEVASAVVQVVERFEPIAKAKGVSIVRRRIDAGVADASRAALSSIAANLVKNAIEACERGGRVEVAVRTTTGGLEIVVEDDGRGMSADTLAALYGSRARPADTSRPRGIGASVVRALVERAGGTIRATSNEGAGSCVRVALPRVRRRTLSSGVRERPASMRVLVVDDHAPLAELIASTLEMRGAKVRIASAPAEALSAVARDRFDVAFVDLDLGGSSGSELIRTLVDRQLVPRVIVMTGASALPELGAHGLLRKPFDLGELESLMHAPVPARARRAR